MERMPFVMELTIDEARCVQYALKTCAHANAVILQTGRSKVDPQILKDQIEGMANALLMFSVPFHKLGWCNDEQCMWNKAS